jgi:hypothetical protein
MFRSLQVAVAAALIAAAGCSKSFEPTPDPAIGGYTLTMANGSPLPATLPASGTITSSTALNGSIFLDKDGTYTGIVELRIARGSVVTIEPYGVPNGVWQRLPDNRLELQPATGSEKVVYATNTATTLTVVSQGIVYVYTRQ